jgi:hypothetical protein
MVTVHILVTIINYQIKYKSNTTDSLVAGSYKFQVSEIEVYTKKLNTYSKSFLVII